jgi:nicotinamide mononucleotide transporter
MTLTRNNIFPAFFLITGLVVQVVAYVLVPDNPWSLVSGLFGICSVVLCSQGNILTFFFGFGQILTYTWLCWLERFYAGIAMNVFYFVSQIYGIYVWRRRMAPEDVNSQISIVNSQLKTRSLSAKVFILLSVTLVACSAATGFLLSRFTDDTQPYFDAFTTVPAVAAQILMVMAYRQQWYIWFAIDVLYVFMWAQAGNACMLMQYAFWCANCIYGYIIWTRRTTPS